MELPDDLRFIPLKYAGRCGSCEADLEVGRRAHWSPSAKKIWCVDCAGAPSSRVFRNDATQGSTIVIERTGSKTNEPHEPRNDSSQASWHRLCAYARRCIEAEAAKSLVPYAKEGSLWFFHAGEEQLITGNTDFIPAPDKLADHLNSPTRKRDRRSVLYGWPLVIVKDRDQMLKAAPLFVVHIEPEPDSDERWKLHAAVEPEFNFAITASGIFDPSINEEIEELLGEGLPFGSIEDIRDLADQTVRRLGIGIVAPLDPRKLETRAARRQGVYNAAISVITEVSAYNIALVDELRRLQCRDDWISTAAASLIPEAADEISGRQTRSGPLAAPFLCNRSQEETLDRFRNEPLTVVTGLPGTGKTQLVVNAVVNSWLDGDKVLVTSTNNAAVDVAVERAEREIGSGLLIRTGNRDVREQVPGRVVMASEHASACTRDQAQARAQLRLAAREREQLAAKLTRLDGFDDEMLSVAEELEKVGSAANTAARALWTKGVVPEGTMDATGIERRANRLLRAWFFRRWRTRRLRKRLGCLETASLDRILDWARLHRAMLLLIERFEALRHDHGSLKNEIGDPAAAIATTDAKWKETSLIAVEADTAAHIRSGVGRLAAFGMASSGGGAFKRAIAGSLDHLRGWACTALSVSPNFELEAGLFDLVIVDEASQCSLAAMLPLAYRAKRLAVVGDPCQLPPIVTVGPGHLRSIAEESGFDSDDLRRRGTDHRDGSAYFAFEFAARPVEPVLLDEHYRCHPHIARWFNRTFYNNRLTVLTEIGETGRRYRAISWKDVEGVTERSSDTGSWVNRAEARQVLEQVNGLLNSGLTVGVVTPFTAQGQLIDRLAKERFDRSILEEAGFVSGTAHRLQGNERDAVVISTVLSPDMPRTTVQWIEKERNLLNVAVSRARSVLTVLGHPAIGELGSPTLSSLRVYVRDEVARVESVTQPSATFRTDSRSEELLLEEMQLRELKPLAKLNVEGYELDFALMEQGIKLNVEVDGDQHLDSRGRQRRQDLTRDRVLSNLGWTVLRVPAWRCHQEIDLVVHEIRDARDRLI